MEYTKTPHAFAESVLVFPARRWSGHLRTLSNANEKMMKRMFDCSLAEPLLRR